MLQYLKEYGQYAEITGYLNVTFDKVEAFLKSNRKQTRQSIDIQFFDANLVATQEHLYFAVLNALQAFKNKTNHSKSPAMETMLYASAQRQIKRALECCGIKSQTTNVAVTIIGDDPAKIHTEVEALTECIGSKPDESVLDLTKSKEAKIKKAFNITQEEIKTLECSFEKSSIVNLVIERVALLATQF
jgi:tRNA threonylcarbamoyladenosine modification (KEOPS) complex Cgi121 subunit